MYEYKYRRFPGRFFWNGQREAKDIENYLNEVAREGWQLHAMSTCVGMTLLGNTTMIQVDLVLKREVEDGNTIEAETEKEIHEFKEKQLVENQEDVGTRNVFNLIKKFLAKITEIPDQSE